MTVFEKREQDTDTDRGKTTLGDGEKMVIYKPRKEA